MQIQEIKEEGMLVGFTTDDRYWGNPLKIEFPEMEEEEEDEHLRT